jgi:hypothetical protein
MMPVGPRLDVENPRRRHLQNLSEQGVAKKPVGEDSVIPVAVSHHLRSKSDSIIQPLLRLTPPENPLGNWQELWSKVLWDANPAGWNSARI